MKILPFAALLFLALPAWAAAPAWQAQPAKSTIGFTAHWHGQPVAGHFPAFTLTARLDPSHPAGGQISLSIATAKLTAQSPDIARAIRGKAWFDVKQYPEATFESEAITKNAEGGLRLRGRLRIKGHEKTVAFPLKIGAQGKTLDLAGKLTLDRTDFAIGSGQWASGKLIAHKVTVAFSIVLAPAGRPGSR